MTFSFTEEAQPAGVIARKPSARFAPDAYALVETQEVPSDEEVLSRNLPSSRSDHRRKTISTCVLAQALDDPSVLSDEDTAEEARHGMPVKVRPSTRRRTWHDENAGAAFVGSEALRKPRPQHQQPMKIHLSMEEPNGGLRLSDAMQARDPPPSSTAIARSRSGSNLLAPPGLTPTGLPSHGSVLHGSGNCRPCAWFWKPGGCQNGKECGHCHLCPEGEIKNRKKGKHSSMRLGLSTPKAYVYSPFGLASSFGFPDNAFALESRQEEPWGQQAISIHIEPESTTCSSSDDVSCARASPANTSASGSEDEEAMIPAGPPPGFEAFPEYGSQGFTDHDRGSCKPCAWFWKPSGCQNGSECNFCHLCANGVLKQRKKTKHASMRNVPQAPATLTQEVMPVKLATLL
jgi:hypothetical protein